MEWGDIVEEYTIENMTLWLICLKGLSEGVIDEMYRLCGSERRKKADRIRQGEKRRQSICAGYLVYLLKQRFAVAEEPVLSEEGKPVFQGHPEVYFNISHSGDYVVLAFGSRELGVDIERVRRAGLKTARRFFTGEEYEYLLETREEERDDAFFRIWTGKEAVVKAAGCGLSVSPERFCVLGEEVELEGKRYELRRRRFVMGEQTVWICAAQLMEG